jgi:hypothetical protein
MGCSMRWSPRGLTADRPTSEVMKRESWRELGVLAVSVQDERLTWPERELIRQLGEKLYGKPYARKVRS